MVGTARVLSDGVCNAYLLDVWTQSTYRRRGIGSTMVEALSDTVPGQHVALFTGVRRGLLRVAWLWAGRRHWHVGRGGQLAQSEANRASVRQALIVPPRSALLPGLLVALVPHLLLNGGDDLVVAVPVRPPAAHRHLDP